ncbi:MAG: hypothetical protein UX77_C0010G0049 [Parcubacteria group bacterium GW2011_GWA1_47_11]|nr:MAG: hypothetical protein UX77_C0010G0049 [Parcubacteria group bacterium GW2011_GWA1_47_11]
MILFGIIGLIVISIAIWLKEKKQDICFVVGGVFLLAYSLSIKNVIFSILQIIFILSALAELLKKKRH